MSEERLLNLLREVEPYLLDVCKQGGFHAVAAGELHTRISNILFLEKFKGILKQEPNEMEILRAELAALKDATVHIYNSGYHAGHHDTIEGRYVDIHTSDMGTYHAEEVAELVRALEEK